MGVCDAIKQNYDGILMEKLQVFAVCKSDICFSFWIGVSGGTLLFCLDHP